MGFNWLTIQRHPKKDFGCLFIWNCPIYAYKCFHHPPPPGRGVWHQARRHKDLFHPQGCPWASAAPSYLSPQSRRGAPWICVPPIFCLSSSFWALGCRGVCCCFVFWMLWEALLTLVGKLEAATAWVDVNPASHLQLWRWIWRHNRANHIITQADFQPNRWCTSRELI